MFLLRTTLLVCILLFCLCSSNGQLFNKYGPAATKQSSGYYKQNKRPNWAFWMPEVQLSIPSLKLPWSLSTKAHGAMGIENSTTESSYTTRKELFLSVQASTTYIYRTTTQPPDILITSDQIVTSLPQTGVNQPKDELLRKQSQTDKPKLMSNSNPNYDTEFWPPNKAVNTKKHPIEPHTTTQKPTRSTRLYKDTTSVTAPKSDNNNQNITNATTVLPSIPVSMTTPLRLMHSTTTERTTQLLREDTTQVQSVISTVFMRSGEKAKVKTPVTATMSESTVGNFFGFQWTTKATNKAAKTTMEITNVLHTLLTTASSGKGN